MSLEFVIIPFNSTFEETALSIKSNLTDSVPSIEIEFDSDYSKSYNSRVNKWKQEDYNIIMVNKDYDDGNFIHVAIDGKNREKMTIEEFIELVSNFEHNSDDDSDKSGEEATCVIC